MKINKVLLLLTAVFLTQNIWANDLGKPRTVTSVDLKRYAGKWFEIARFPNRFQKKCLGNVTAEYALKEEDKIEVVNQCLKVGGKIERAKGEARIADRTSNAKLEVRFAPKFLSFIPLVWGDYWILDLGQDYDYALVGSPDRKYLWILSRSPKLPEAVYEKLRETARREGFNPDRLVKTAQS